MRIICLVCGFVFTALSVHAASFDCSKAVSLAEKVVCKQKSLSHLDEKLASVYGKALSTTSDRDKLKHEQRLWIKKRDACGADTECLYSEYSNRISSLMGFSHEGVLLTKSFTINVSQLIDSCKITYLNVLFDSAKDGFRYLVLDIMGQSKCGEGLGHCGSGSEQNLLWLKLDPNYQVMDFKSVLINSCFESIEGSHHEIKNNMLIQTFSDYRFDKSETLLYDNDLPEKGFSVQTQVKEKQH